MTKQAVTPISTKFSDKEGMLINSVASKQDIAVAKFIRTSTVRRAVDFANADGKQTDFLRMIARSVVGQLRQPQLTRSRTLEKTGDQETDVMSTGDYLSDDPDVCRDREAHDQSLQHQGWTLGIWEPVVLDQHEIQQIKLAMDHAGTVFIDLLKEVWDEDMHKESQFEPYIDMGLLDQYDPPRVAE